MTAQRSSPLSHGSFHSLIPILSITLVCLLLTAFLSPPVLAGGHGETGKLEHRVSTENKSGLNLFLSKLYNDHRLLYSLVVTFTMAILGIVVAQVTDFVLKLLGAKKASRMH